MADIIRGYKEQQRSQPLEIGSMGMFPTAPSEHRTKGVQEGASRHASTQQYEHIQEVMVSGEMVPAQDLLPEHMKDLYGYVPEDLIENSEDWDCLAFSMLFNDASLRNDLNEGKAAPGAEYFSKNYNLMEITSDDQLRPGDVIYFDIQKPQLKGFFGENHACVVVGNSSDGPLVFSKNGEGPTTPFLLYTYDQVLNAYSGPGKEVTAYLYRRNVRSLFKRPSRVQ